jgi:hypothetical protein
VAFYSPDVVVPQTYSAGVSRWRTMHSRVRLWVVHRADLDGAFSVERQNRDQAAGLRRAYCVPNDQVHSARPEDLPNAKSDRQTSAAIDAIRGDLAARCRYDIASAQAMCPSKPSVLAMSR